MSVTQFSLFFSQLSLTTEKRWLFSLLSTDVARWTILIIPPFSQCTDFYAQIFFYKFVVLFYYYTDMH